MKKKIIFIIAIIIIAIIVGEVYVSKNNEKANNEIQNNETENISVENEVSKNDVEKNDSNEENTSLNKTNETKNNTSNSSNSENQESATKVKKQVFPSGFMGSSMYRVNLYENGDVYVVTYDGTGYEDKNITSKDLIAKNATSIEKIEDGDFEGGVRVKSNNPVTENFGWVEFSK